MNKKNSQAILKIHGIDISIFQFGEAYGLEKQDKLLNFWGIKIGDSLVMRHAWIDSKEKAQELVKAAQLLQNTDCAGSISPLHLVSLQIATPEEEWDYVSFQHILLHWINYEKGLSSEIAHIEIPISRYYIPKDEPSQSEFFLKAVSKLPSLLNIDAWEMYCYWLSESIENFLESISLEDLTTYTLEGVMKDFLHEVRTSLVRSLHRGVSEALLKIGALQGLIDYPINEKEDIVELEKNVIRARNAAKSELQNQYALLTEIEAVITAIESDHKQFIPLKRQAGVLRLLFGHAVDAKESPRISWVQQSMLMPLLHHELGVITAMNCDTGLDRTNILFAIHISMHLMQCRFSFEALMDMAITWNESVRWVNKQLIAGQEKFEKWLKEPSEDVGEDQIKRRAMLIEQFRAYFLWALENICIPYMMKNVPVHEVKWHESQIENLEYLQVFPVFGDLFDGNKKIHRAPIVKINSSTGNPQGLTKAGHFLITRLRDLFI